MLYTVAIDKVEQGYKIVPTDHVCGGLREAELWVRVNFQVTPEEWSELKAKLESMGKASVERSAGKTFQLYDDI